MNRARYWRPGSPVASWRSPAIKRRNSVTTTKRPPQTPAASRQHRFGSSLREWAALSSSSWSKPRLDLFCRSFTSLQLLWWDAIVAVCCFGLTGLTSIDSNSNDPSGLTTGRAGLDAWLGGMTSSLHIEAPTPLSYASLRLKRPTLTEGLLEAGLHVMRLAGKNGHNACRCRYKGRRRASFSPRLPLWRPARWWGSGF